MQSIITAIGAPKTDWGASTEGQKSVFSCSSVTMGCKNCRVLREKFGILWFVEAMRILGQNASVAAVENFIESGMTKNQEDKALKNCDEPAKIPCEYCKIHGKPSTTASMTVTKEDVRRASANAAEVFATLLQGS
jgi:hypothetical protein